jgi:glycosyltransferase involved in cell wall biosynthesis
MDRLRVAHIITRLELGGAQQNTLYTVSHLDRNLFEPFLITGKGGILDEEAQKLDGVSVHFCPSLVREIGPATDWAAYRELKSLLSRLRPDVVHTHSSKAGVLGRFAAQAAGVPVVIHTYHGFGFHRFQNPIVLRFYVEVEKKACRRAHHLVFVSQANLDWAKELGLTSGCGTSLIRSGVKTQPLLDARRTDHIRQALGVSSEKKAVGMIACLKPQKDPLTFVEAADLVTQKRSDAFFFLIGDGELRPQVQKRVSRMKHPERFQLLSWRRDIPELLASLDLTVLTSLWEGLPRVIPEATIAGVPVIASDIEGNREIVHEGRNGALAQPRNAPDFAERIIAALQNQWTVDPVFSGQICEEFNIDRMVSRQQDLYLNIRPSKHA